MNTAIDYYFSVASPWTFLGSERFIRLVKHTSTEVNVRPMDFSQVLAASGGLPYQQRAIQRASYRQVDLSRWSCQLDIALTLEPKFYPVDRMPASHLVIAARSLSSAAALDVSHAILRAIWQEDRNIADWQTLTEIACEAGFDGAALVNAAQKPGIAEAFQHDTDCAIKAEVFGAPTWVVNSERFWGQDRLDFLEKELRKNLMHSSIKLHD